jgi:hypothetical protein
MKPYITLFHKEFRQQGALAPAMVIMCLCMQFAYYEGAWFFHYSLVNASFFYIALITTAFYAGAAAALAYSTEHAENTFIFLRKMPVSQGMIAGGKTAWVFLGTVLVTIGNVLLAAAWTGGQLDQQLWLAVGFGIIEAFIWGFFWSTRCRSQVHALLATYFCAAVTVAILGNVFQPNNTNVTDAYIAILPHRAAAMGIIGTFAVWGMFRWFKYEYQRPTLARLFPEHRTMFGYPRNVQLPFLALIHQHLRHASMLYYVGLLCFALFSVGSIAACVFWNDHRYYKSIVETPYWTIGAFICIGGIVLFWGNIFGHDQRGDSYRFLSRLGIHEGRVWWSRMLPALILYVPVGICFFAFFLASSNGIMGDEFWIVLGAIFAVWLVPVAVGAFISISLRSQLVAIVLTAGGIVLPCIWMGFGVSWFAASPLWTTVPICIALLMGSRIRAAYWLRENFTWRSRLIPLVPLFVTLLAVLIAVPFVRIYSVPDISWEQVDAYFDKADMMKVRRDSEKRKALLQYIAKHNTVPPEYKMLYNNLIHGHGVNPQACTYEEYLLLQYLFWSDAMSRPAEHEYERSHWEREDFIYYMPWEKTRTDRKLRLQLVATLVDKGYLYDKSAGTIWKQSKSQSHSRGLLDADVNDFTRTDALRDQKLCSEKLSQVFSAVNRFYNDHDKTLPQSLEELVEKHYLSEMPTHPFTGEPVKYRVNAPAPRIDYSVRSSTSIHFLGEDTTRNWRQKEEREKQASAAFNVSGGTSLQLGQWRYVIIEVTEEE